MTDNEIIQALECCRDNGTSNTYCDDCAYSVYEDCGARQAKDALDLINRQQAEIERLKDIAKSALNESINICDSILDAKAEAIKEFAKRLKSLQIGLEISGESLYYVSIDCIDNLVKEMVGDAE